MNILSFIKKFHFEFILLVLLVVMYQKFWSEWFSLWSDVESPYAFAFFVFAFCAYFLKTNYQNLVNTSKNIDYRGLLLLLPGLVFYSAGLRTDITYMTALSLPLFVSGAILFLYGANIFKKLFVLLILLAFAFPFFPIRRLTIPLQGISAHLSSDLLNFLGINSYTEGNVVNVGQCKLAVVAGCSGLKSLSTFFFTSIIFTFFMQVSKLKKILFVLFTIPLSIVMNVFRLTFVGFYSLYNGYDGLEKFHDNLGIVVAVLSISIMVLTAKFIENKGENNEA